MKTGTLTNIGQHDWVAVSLTANQACHRSREGALPEEARRCSCGLGNPGSD
jgi:hypothetical protein